MRRAVLFLTLGSLAVGIACVVNPQPLPPEALSDQNTPNTQRDAGASAAENSDSATGPFQNPLDAGDSSDSATPSSEEDASVGPTTDGGASDAAVTDGGPNDAAVGG